MVWNDWFDRDEDARERPFRPLPSGAISGRTAALLGSSLFAVGLGAAGLAGWRGGSLAPPVLAGLIVAAVLLYDGWLKRTPVGPVSMASCRFLNVLLGVSLAGTQVPWALRFHLASAVGVYIVGVTWFARTEATTSSRVQLRSAAGVGLAALLLALPIPTHLPPGGAAALFPYLLVAFGLFVGLPAARAVAEPSPKHVQAAVKRAVLGLVAFDAVLATATPAGGLWPADPAPVASRLAPGPVGLQHVRSVPWTPKPDCA
jgi:4-hydroxybenzoate polyprenyltransferase